MELALRVAREHKPSEWMLEHGVALDKPTDLLVNDIGLAIEIATCVDELRLNYNPEIDWPAYEAVERGLSQLIQKGKFAEAKALSLRLIDKRSYQMECSDEGLMVEAIETCLRPVIAAVAESSSDDGWALRMLQHDRIGCICERELTMLAGTTREN